MRLWTTSRAPARLGFTLYTDPLNPEAPWVCSFTVSAVDGTVLGSMERKVRWDQEAVVEAAKAAVLHLVYSEDAQAALRAARDALKRFEDFRATGEAHR